MPVVIERRQSYSTQAHSTFRHSIEYGKSISEAREEREKHLLDASSMKENKNRTENVIEIYD